MPTGKLLTKDEKAYKALIMADLNIVYHYADSANKSEKLQAAYRVTAEWLDSGDTIK